MRRLVPQKHVVHRDACCKRYQIRAIVWFMRGCDIPGMFYEFHCTAKMPRLSVALTVFVCANLHVILLMHLAYFYLFLVGFAFEIVKVMSFCRRASFIDGVAKSAKDAPRKKAISVTDGISLSSFLKKLMLFGRVSRFGGGFWHT